jgi:hypothetical protein
VAPAAATATGTMLLLLMMMMMMMMTTMMMMMTHLVVGVEVDVGAVEGVLPCQHASPRQFRLSRQFIQPDD